MSLTNAQGHQGTGTSRYSPTLRCFIGSIDNNETVEAPLQPGQHTVQIRHGRYSSRELPFDVTDGDAIDFRCYGARIWPIYVTSIVLPTLAIALKRE
jgi:hypothetical protein